MIAIYSNDGKTVVDLVSIEAFLDMPARVVGEYIQASVL